MNWLLDGLDYVDVWCLCAVRTGVQWCVEWLSLSQRTIERFLLGVFLAASLGCLLLQPVALVWRAFGLFAMLAWYYNLLSDYRRPSAERVWRLGSRRECRVRLLMLTLLGFAAIADLAPPVSWLDLLRLSRDASLVLALYVMAWPRSGEPGKRRRAALAEWKDSFGHQWMPEGVKG